MNECVFIIKIIKTKGYAYVSDHAIKLFSFRDCCSTTYLRNRSVEILATVALVQAIQEAQNPPATVPQEDIGKYIKILGEALQLSQPINSNSISKLAINKCFCTRRNHISISAAAIYLACQLEDEKNSGRDLVPLRKVHKYLLENWEDLLPSNYAPAEHSLPL
ncbi:hypothetical protein DVH24_026466 [Malus domestica]|uniref:Transcription factor TFIIB cyclin-like domain-containing protein n=1 Tax=Malus domestica TaxID=3750 RepID=A0A498KG66_MALDO|nr:hypothetical protein DVH24_026466 [Malus domestica]